MISRSRCNAPVVHVYCVDVDTDRTCDDCFEDVLSCVELQRAAQFRNASVQIRYLRRRAKLRGILARHLDCGANEVEIAVRRSGKPFIPGSNLGFSVSHSQGMALFACARRADVGCDIEFVRSDYATPEAAALFMTAEERAFLELQKGQAGTEAFFRCWTRKEAWLKALGTGFAASPCAATVWGPGSPRVPGWPAGELLRWSLTDVPAPAGYVGALALRKHQSEAARRFPSAPPALIGQPGLRPASD